MTIEQGLTQSWSAERYARTARFVSDLGMPVVELLAPGPGECILDLGCGDGALTEKLAALGARVIGVDSAPDFIAAAKARGLDARLMNGEALALSETFDAVFSNAAMHWMLDQDAVMKGVFAILRPGGRFVVEMGGVGNVQTIATAVKAALSRRGIDPAPLVPWVFPTVEEQTARLKRHGFAVVSMALIPRPTPLPGALGDWLENFAEAFIKAVPPAEREAMKAEIAETLAPRLKNAEGCWIADYVRLRFSALRPADGRAAPCQCQCQCQPGGSGAG
ncbi:MAG: methyltransferase domain-containing protein [Alphaproteobacteria bacterium]